MANDAPIAIIGLSYRAPGVGRKGLYDYLAHAKTAWSKMPAARFDQVAFCTPGLDKPGCFKVEGAHFLPDDIYAFDAAFFNMRAEEARHSDPQHRLMLECALEAAESAGQTLLDLAGGNVGVFVACGSQEYAHRVAEDLHRTTAFTATGIASCMAANRLSYFFDIHGPSVAIEAACASSAYATHQACQALLNGECNAAFVGAAAICFSPNLWVTLEKMGALSADGKSYSYDHKAAGFGRGEGGACLLVKRLNDAVRDGDPVHAIIRGSACTHCGRSEGITMPSRWAQEKLLRRVHESAGLSPSETPVVEGHGTATPAGDPIEASAFASVLAKDRTEANPLWIGSVKSNFGHLEGASGILGIIKAILMVKHGVILPTAGFEQINRRIEGREKLRVAQVPMPWPRGEPIRALVTNFGFGGSNSAVLLEQAPHAVDKGRTAISGSYESDKVKGTNGTKGAKGVNGISGAKDADGVHGIDAVHAKDDTSDAPDGGTLAGRCRRLYVLSAKSERSLSAYLSDFGEYLNQAHETGDFSRDLSYTLGQRRTHHQYRVYAVADSRANLRDKLSAVRPPRARERVVAFVFTGQGAEHARMVSGLDRYGAFRATMSKAEEQLRAMGATWSLAEELEKPAAESRIDDAEISQPACTAVQLALVALLKSWGVMPSIVTGHSSGEIAASYAAGMISFRAAMATAYFRGLAAARLSRIQNRRGGMLALGVRVEDAEQLIDERAGGGYATIAAVNSVNSVTVSGDVSAIENIHEAADSQGLFVRRLNISLAYHSRHMEDVASWYRDAIQPFYDEDAASIESGLCAIFVSSVTGSVVKTSSVDPSYWVKNLVQTVRFSDAIQSLFVPRDKSSVAKIPSVIVEIGPHAALKNSIKQTVDLTRPHNPQALKSFVYLPSLLRGATGDEAVLNLAGGLFAAGVSIRLGDVNQTDLHTASVLTDLPAYAWDKAVSYQIMPRNTKELLFPGEPVHDLLGRKIASTGPHEHTYRQVFTLDDLPWIRDHNVSGAVIFPMTGYLANAIEAARRAASSAAATFVVRDFHAIRSLEIQEEQTVDMVTKLKPAATGAGSFSATAWSFEVSTWSEEGGWASHCYGRIESEAAEMEMETPTLSASLELVNAPNVEQQDTKAAYAHTSIRGTRYGPAFLNTTKYLKGDGFTVIEQQLRDLGKMLPSPYGSPYSVDPPTLDGFLQGGGTFKEIDWTRLALMPNYVSRLRVSNHIPTDRNHRLTVVTRLLGYDAKGGRLRMSVAAFVRDPNSESYVPVAEWESVTFRSLVAGDDQDPAAALPVNWRWEMLPRLDLLPAEEVPKRFKFSVGDLTEDQLAHGRKMHQVACYYIEKALEATADDDRSQLPKHLSSFVRWSGRAAAREHIDSPVDPATLVEEVRNHDAQGELLCAIGDVLVPILRKEVQPLEVMLRDGLLTRHYEADVSNAMFSQIVGDLVHNLSHLDPNMRILEVGGGTAGTTLHVLNALSRDREDGAFLRYTFTDISSGFFESARTKLARWAHRLTYEKLDISKDPTAQGFATGEFDLVIAANVLHATANMTDTMTNVRSLLRPNGRLICLEANRHAPLALPFALLPGWWYAEDDYRDREEGPLLTMDAWNRLLIDLGFSGVDVLVQDRPGEPDQMLSVFCSRRVGKPRPDAGVTICGPFMDDEEVDFAEAVAESIADRMGCQSSVKPFAEIDPAKDPYCIIIDSPRQSLLRDLSSSTFEMLKSLISHSTGILWVVPEGGPPEVSIIKGMLRTVRLEYEPKSLLMLDGVPATSQGVNAILKMATLLRDPEVAAGEDQDFFWRSGALHQARMRPLKELKERFGIEQGVPVRTVQKLGEAEGMLEMTMESAGSPESIYFRRTDLLCQPVAADEVVVHVEAAGLSFRDLSIVFGTVPWAAPGFDGVGRVVKTGSRVAHLHEGDRVLFLSLEGSAFVTYERLRTWHVARVPPDMSTTNAASLPLAYTVAIAALVHTAHLRRDETVLIHSAASGVGYACVVVAQHLGARIFVTAGTAEKRAFLHDVLGIPESHIFSSRTPNFRDGIMCATDGKGVDVVVNSLSGELMQESWGLTAAFGRFVDVAIKDAGQNGNLAMKPFERGATFRSLDLRGLFEHKPESLKGIFSEFVSLLRQGVAVPIKPVTVVPISRFVDGLRMLKAGNNTGKIVVTLGKEESVLADSALRPTKVLLDPNATVLITGGTRGIGLALANWMIENGARNVVVLGRSGSANPDVQKLLQKHEGTAVKVRALTCDVSDRESLADTLESIRDLPPVRGVVHSALILNDKLLVNATYDDWKLITGPRIKGAWHLHDLLPDLDFFIALSSFLGDSGNPGQSIYAGTASFYDAFSRFRNALGKNTVSIALPVVLGVGFVADHDLADKLRVTLGGTLRIEDIKTVVKAAIQGQSSPFVHDGKAVVFKLHVHGKPLDDIPWAYFHPVLLKDRLSAESGPGNGMNADGGGSADHTASWTTAADPLVGLSEALVTKVSAMTMIARDEVEADAPLLSHGLDSLVSVELRNWIRRETGVELALTTITQAASLRALAAHILGQADGRASTKQVADTPVVNGEADA